MAVEIKAGETVSSSYFRNLNKLRKYLPEHVVGDILVHGAETDFTRNQVRVTGPVGFVPALAELEREILG